MKTETELQLAKLVSMPTITDDADANEMALGYIELYLGKRGMYCKRFTFDGHGALMATIQPGVKNPKVLLSAHVDVVEGDESLFTLCQDGDRLRGRGTYDMKFAAAAYMQLVDDLQDDLDAYDFGIMITTDEEYGGRDDINGTKRLLEKGYRPQIAIVPDGGTDWNIETLAKGKWRFDLIAKGRTAHGSRPWEGESASFKLVQALSAIKRHFNGHGPLTDTLNIGMIQGGVAFNQVPSTMSAWIEIRFASDESVAKNQLVMQRICKKYGVQVRTRVLEPPLKHDFNNTLISQFARSIERVVGVKPTGCLSYASSDAIYLMAQGIPCVVVRPPGGNHHGPEEWISRQGLVQLAPVLKDYLETTAKTMPATVDSQAVLV